MSKRITNATLEAICARINRMTNSPLEAYTKDVDGRHKVNIGNYHLSFAYGGVSLCRMHNTGGGIVDVCNCGHMTKSELANSMYAFIRGYEMAQDDGQKKTGV